MKAKETKTWETVFYRTRMSNPSDFMQKKRSNLLQIAQGKWRSQIIHWYNMFLALKFVVITLIYAYFNGKSLHLESIIILREKIFFLKKRQSTFVYVHKRHSWTASLCENYYFCWNFFLKNSVSMTNGFHYPRFFNISFKCPLSYIIDFLVIALKLKNRDFFYCNSHQDLRGNVFVLGTLNECVVF